MIKKMIMSKTPLRISFFGGGTDLTSFTKKEFGCVITSSIDKHVYLIAHPSFGGRNIIVYSKREITENIEDIAHTRIKECLKKTKTENGIEIHSLAEVPAGTGLGSSSAFTVGLLNLLYAHNGKFVSKLNLAEEASHIEIDLLKEPIGKQDQYETALGGFNFIRFNPDGSVEIEPILLSEENINKLNKRLILFYLDVTRDASSVLFEQNKNIASDSEKFETMKKLKELTLSMKEELNKGRIENFGKMLHEGWLLKKSMASNISSPEIDNIYEKGLKAGATGGKVLGAGGGGFILFYCEPEKQEELRKALKPLKEFSFNFEREGTKIIYSE
jgi:D-glycero-alpha-D-manno-heptose-7-phosphate kinase